MTHSFCVASLIAACIAAEKHVNLGNWLTSNDDQQRLIETMNDNGRSWVLDMPEVSGFASFYRDEIVAFLVEAGHGDIEVGNFTKPEFAAVGLFEFAAKWLVVGTDVKVLGQNGKYYDGFSLGKAARMQHVTGPNDGILKISLEGGDYVLIEKAAQPFKGTFWQLTDIVEQMVKQFTNGRRSECAEAELLNVDIGEQRELDSLVGMSAMSTLDDLPAIVRKVTQGNKIRMDKFGCQVSSATVMMLDRCVSMVYRLDRPFFWVLCDANGLIKACAFVDYDGMELSTGKVAQPESAEVSDSDSDGDGGVAHEDSVFSQALKPRPPVNGFQNAPQSTGGPTSFGQRSGFRRDGSWGGGTNERG